MRYVKVATVDIVVPIVTMLIMAFCFTHESTSYKNSSRPSFVSYFTVTHMLSKYVCKYKCLCCKYHMYHLIYKCVYICIFSVYTDCKFFNIKHFIPPQSISLCLPLFCLSLSSAGDGTWGPPSTCYTSFLPLSDNPSSICLLFKSDIFVLPRNTASWLWQRNGRWSLSHTHMYILLSWWTILSSRGYCSVLEGGIQPLHTPTWSSTPGWVKKKQAKLGI